MNRPTASPHRPSRQRTFLLWIALGAIAAVLGGGLAVLIVALFETRPAESHTFVLAPPDSAAGAPAAAAPEIQNYDFSTSNSVSTALGEETPADGLRHLHREADGRTTVETIDGVTCRHHLRTNKSFGYVYFAIDETFKRDALKAARVEVEFRVPRPTLMRLQYDALAGEVHKRYQGAVPDGTRTVQLAPTAHYLRVWPSNEWQSVAFDINDGAFVNSQNGGADFRLEMTPPEIYVRRVSVTRAATP